MNEKRAKSPRKGCLGYLCIFLLLLFGFPVSIYLRHTVIPTNTLTVTVYDSAGQPVVDAKLRFSRLTNLMWVPILFSDTTPLKGTSIVTTDSTGRATFRAGCDSSQLDAVEQHGVPLPIQSARRIKPASNNDDGTVWWSPWADSRAPEWKVTVRK
ncbi:Ig-like domain-containing protein [Verrucomicrobiota bacterium sgz303538]